MSSVFDYVLAIAAFVIDLARLPALGVIVYAIYKSAQDNSRQNIRCTFAELAGIDPDVVPAPEQADAGFRARYAQSVKLKLFLTAMAVLNKAERLRDGAIKKSQYNREVGRFLSYVGAARLYGFWVSENPSEYT